MPSKEDPDYEPTKFRRKELSSRNSKLSYIIFFSILAVSIGIANVVLFNFEIPAAKRELYNCTIGSTFDIQPQYLNVWASVGIFAVFSFIVAPIAKSTTNAWSPQTTAFYYMAPFVALLSIGIAVAAGFLGGCAAYFESYNKITSLETIKDHPKVFYALLDLLLVISEIAVFFLLLSAWLQIRSKRNRSKETKEKEDGEKLNKKTNNEPKTASETPAQTEVTSTPVSPPTAPLKNASEESPATKATPNVYFIQAPAAPAALPSPPQQDLMNPYSAYGYNPGYNPGYFDPYDVPYYPMPPPPPPQPPRRPRPRRPGFRPFRKGYGVRINRGYSVFPY